MDINHNLLSVEFNQHKETSFIKEVIWADEYYPSEEGYIFIGKIKEF